MFWIVAIRIRRKRRADSENELEVDPILGSWDSERVQHRIDSDLSDPDSFHIARLDSQLFCRHPYQLRVRKVPERRTRIRIESSRESFCSLILIDLDGHWTALTWFYRVPMWMSFRLIPYGCGDILTCCDYYIDICWDCDEIEFWLEGTVDDNEKSSFFWCLIEWRRSKARIRLKLL